MAVTSSSHRGIRVHDSWLLWSVIRAPPTELSPAEAFRGFWEERQFGADCAVTWRTSEAVKAGLGAEASTNPIHLGKGGPAPAIPHSEVEARAGLASRAACLLFRVAEEAPGFGYSHAGRVQRLRGGCSA